VAAAWSKILGRTDLPVDANFFDVGGHSLLVPALQVAIQTETGTNVSIVDLFTATTIAAQTELVRAAAVPADDTATQVAAAWSKILGKTDLPVDANFFDVGGHSLLVPALQVALENETGTTVSIVDLFAATTVTAQTELVRAAAAPAAAPEETDDRRARMAARSRRSAGAAR
jgi:aryl carrier-like protein